MPSLEAWELAAVYVVGFGGVLVMAIAAVCIVIGERKAGRR